MDAGGDDDHTPCNVVHGSTTWASDAEWPISHTHERPLWAQLITNLQDEWSSLFIFLNSSLLSFHTDTLLVVAVAAAAPCFFFYYTLPNGQMMDFNQSWTLVSILIVFPLTMTLSSVFARREEALRMLAQLKANLVSIFLAHQQWDWYSIPKDTQQAAVSGRAHILPPDHVRRVHAEIMTLAHTMRVFLMAPTVSRARNYYTAPGRRERRAVTAHAMALSERMAHALSNISRMCEELKAAGLPANEATRIRQYATAVAHALQTLCLIKKYRTPLGLRAFSRVFVIMLPALFGPYYASMAASTHIAFSVTYSVIISIALLGIFNLRFDLEDPFHRRTVDAVDLEDELHGLESDLRVLLAADAPSGGCAPQAPQRVAPQAPPTVQA